jgi:hypothetical protein
VSRRTAQTIRIFSLEVSPNLVLLNIRKVDFHNFWNYWKVTSSQNGFKTFFFVTLFGNTIFLKARASVSQIEPMKFPKKWHQRTSFLGKWESIHFPCKWLPLLCLFMV